MRHPEQDGAGPAKLEPSEALVFGRWLERWRLTPDGAPFAGNNSRLLPVRRDGRALVLKAAMDAREIRAAAYLQALGGVGAVDVLARQDDAVLMERATGERSLAAMEEAGEAEAALSILCAAAAVLHAPRSVKQEDLVPLQEWFERLHHMAGGQGGVLARASVEVRRLLAEPREVRVLHGDLHHWNVLDGGGRGWLAIDPNGVLGERAFEFALMVLPANLREDTDPTVLGRRARLVAGLAGVAPRRLLAWVAGQAALWASWSAPGRNWPAVTEAALSALDQVGEQ